MLNVGLNRYDPYFGALSKNLQAEHYKKKEIEQAKEDLSEAVKGKKKITSRIKELYQKTYPINLDRKIHAIKREVVDFGFETALGILEAPSSLTGKWDPKFENFTTTLNSFIEKKVDTLVKLGKVDALEKYMNIIYEEFQIPEEEIFKSFSDKIFEEFSHGYPTACSAVSTFLKVQIKNNTNPNSAKHLLITLKRLANLGNAIAQTELRNILYLEESISTNALQLSSQERIEGLKQLASSGHLLSQLSLIRIYNGDTQTNTLSEISLNQKKEIINHLIQNKNTHSQSFVKIIEFDRSLSLSNRIQTLSTYSQKGCLDSFNCLFVAYVNNRLQEEELSLNKEARLIKLHELKMMNPAIWNENFVRINLKYPNGFDNEKDLLQSHLSYQNLFTWLEEQGFENNNQYARFYLTKAYRVNELQNSASQTLLKLEIPLKRRLESLIRLADKAYCLAQTQLYSYWFPSEYPFNNIRFSKGEYITYPSNVIFNHLLKWIFINFQNPHDFKQCVCEDMQKRFLNLLKDERKRKSMEYLFKILKVFNDTKQSS